MASLDEILAGGPVLETILGETIYFSYEYDYRPPNPHLTIEITDGNDYGRAFLNVEEVALLSHYLITWLEERSNVNNE